MTSPVRNLGWLISFTRLLHRRALLFRLGFVERKIFRKCGATFDTQLSLELDALIIALEELA